MTDYPLILQERLDLLKQYKKTNDTMWHYYQIYTFVPLVLTGVYKLYKARSRNPDSKDYYKPNIVDKIIIAINLYGLFYYFIDLCFTISKPKWNVCDASFTLHHISSLIFLPPLFMPIINYPWWYLGVPIFHGVIEIKSQVFILDGLYFLNIINFNYNLYKKPWSERKRCKLARIVLIFIYISILMMFFNNCDR